MQTIFIFPFCPVRIICSNNSTVFLSTPLLPRRLPPDPSLVRHRLAIGPRKMALVVKIWGPYPQFGETKMIPEHAQVLFKEFAFSCVAHAGQVSALCFPTVNFCFRPREHFVLKENELIYVATAVKLCKKIVMRTRMSALLLDISTIFFFFLGGGGGIVGYPIELIRAACSLFPTQPRNSQSSVFTWRHTRHIGVQKPKPVKLRPYWCTKPILWELDLLMF